MWGDQLEAAFYHYQVVALMLILVGIVFLIVERWNKGRDAKVTTIAQITYRAAFMIGMFQLIAALFLEHPDPCNDHRWFSDRTFPYRSGGVYILLGDSVMFGASLMKVMHFGLHFRL